MAEEVVSGGSTCGVGRHTLVFARGISPSMRSFVHGQLRNN